jgi:hypothetical protein
MRRSVTVKRSTDANAIEVRARETTLGQITRVAMHSDTQATGSFTHRPAYADFAADFLALARALDAGRADDEAAIRRRFAEAELQVWHTTHDMRIDRPGSLAIVDGEARFAPNDAFLMMRTGGL